MLNDLASKHIFRSLASRRGNSNVCTTLKLTQHNPVMSSYNSYILDFVIFGLRSDHFSERPIINFKSMGEITSPSNYHRIRSILTVVCLTRPWMRFHIQCPTLEVSIKSISRHQRSSFISDLKVAPLCSAQQDGSNDMQHNPFESGQDLDRR